MVLVNARFYFLTCMLLFALPATTASDTTSSPNRSSRSEPSDRSTRGGAVFPRPRPLSPHYLWELKLLPSGVTRTALRPPAPDVGPADLYHMQEAIAWQCRLEDVLHEHDPGQFLRATHWPPQLRTRIEQQLRGQARRFWQYLVLGWPDHFANSRGFRRHLRRALRGAWGRVAENSSSAPAA